MPAATVSMPGSSAPPLPVLIMRVTAVDIPVFAPLMRLILSAENKEQRKVRASQASTNSLFSSAVPPPSLSITVYFSAIPQLLS